jgi:transcription-repair coupling factor (superfamily II helicase)
MTSDAPVKPLALKEKNRLIRLIESESCLTVPSPGTAASACLAWTLCNAVPATWVWVLDNLSAMETFVSDLLALQPPGDEHEVLVFPPWDLLPAEGIRPQPETVGIRLSTLNTLQRTRRPRIVVTAVQSLMQGTISADNLRHQTLALEVAGNHDPHQTAEQLAEWGYDFSHEVENRGQASLRGGLLDVWPLSSDWPVRIEFFGDVIDSIRTFDPYEQTSVEKIQRIVIGPTEETGSLHTTLFDYLPPGSHWAFHETETILNHAELYEESLRQLEHEPPGHLPFTEVLERLHQNDGCRIFAGTLSSALPDYTPETFDPGFSPGESMVNLEADIFHPDMMEQSRRLYIHSLLNRAKSGEEVHLYFDTSGAYERFIQLYQEELHNHPFILHIAPLSEGFTVASTGVAAVSENDLYGYEKKRRAKRLTQKIKPPPATRESRLNTWTELMPGEMVVHADHGLGKYLGLYEIKFNGQLQEVLAIEYANNTKLYVPVAQAHLLSRYVGVGRRRPEPHILGSKRWQHQKEAAEKAIEDFASTLLETQGAREALLGHAFAADHPWQTEFEHAFPFDETDDQIRAIREVKQDMESTRPMDRLICGDVGYGKTEVAMRAAFKAVMDGKQVAVLVPTTVLAQQHFYTFSERMAAFPVTIEMLSRFRTHAEQRNVVERLKDGSVDIVIGTHRLVSSDVSFKDLGLVIIDEEQRFGVAHKERLKQLRQLVDVLTLTATPIPRTLYMSLTGAKDMSTIQTPPRERLAVETIITDDSDEIIRKAVMHELNREGQVFFLHNRVQTIDTMHERLRTVLPEARISVAHGQMSEKRLAKVMRKFTENRFNVLLCTTIIESGVDIPNVNTIIIDRADRFGLSELYQLRGRVGRYKHQAYAYLLLPRHKRLFDTARKRISTIKRYSSLGAGFKVALRDLEIRGAGNILGAQQSGHIAAVGFDLYCQMLQRTIAAKKGEKPPPLIHVEIKLDFIERSARQTTSETAAAIPYDYIEEENQRVEMYRRLAAAGSEREVARLQREMRDRFGKLPEPAKRLILLTRLRILAAHASIDHIETRENRLLIQRHGDFLMQGNRMPRLSKTKTTERIREIMRFIKSISME